MTFDFTKSHVKNRGVPPDSFLEELVAWGKSAPEEIFVVNSEPHDIYTSVRPVLGPWESIQHRRAAMLEVMRVLAAYESSWDWNEGVDTSNPASNTPDTEEAGAWQVSANSRAFGPELKALAPADGNEFQKVMKENHPLAMEYIARLLRRTTHHNGPAKRHEIDPWLNRDAVREFMDLMQVTTVPLPVPSPPPIPHPKSTQNFAVYSLSSRIKKSDVMQIAHACNLQCADLYKIWGKRITVTGYGSAEEVPFGYFPVIIKDDIGEDALGYHTDNHGQPICFVKAQSLEDTCVTVSHEIAEAGVDPQGNRYIVIILPDFGKVRCLVEIADPPESFSYRNGNTLPVSDFICPEWYDEEFTEGVKYTFKDNIKTPQTIAQGGYFSFIDQSGRWFQAQWWGDSLQIDGPFSWERKDNEREREMVDRETRARRTA